MWAGCSYWLYTNTLRARFVGTSRNHTMGLIKDLCIARGHNCRCNHNNRVCVFCTRNLKFKGFQIYLLNSPGSDFGLKSTCFSIQRLRRRQILVLHKCIVVMCELCTNDSTESLHSTIFLGFKFTQAARPLWLPDQPPQRYHTGDGHSCSCCSARFRL